MVRYVKKISALFAVATALTISISTPAFALPTAYNLRTEVLTANPTPFEPPSCVSRSIALAPGTYSWTLQLSIPPDRLPVTYGSNPNRTIVLSAGTYVWRDCLQPESGTYSMASTLTPPSGAQATLQVGFALQCGTFSCDDVYQWGSSLALEMST